MTGNPRTANMRANRSKDTSPELRVRSALHALGLRYRLHDKRYPGKPDIILPSRKTAVLVHGCYWHQHGCKLSSLPAKSKEYWDLKFARNKTRDAENEAALKKAGWTVITVWECETRNPDKLATTAAKIAGVPRVPK